MNEQDSVDYLIIGAGIAGASIAYWLARHGSVLLVERESQPGYHSTGRSAALYMESYGPPQVRALTCASRAFFDQPPEGFAEHPLLTPRGALFYATEAQRAELDAHEALVRSVSDKVQRLDAQQTRAMVPVLRAQDLIGAVYEEEASDIDVHALHQGFLRGARAAGARVLCNAEVQSIEREEGERWCVQTSQGSLHARVVVNAAGAWADEMGRLAGAAPIGLQPKRRSAFTFAAPANSEHWPMFMPVDESFYIKPDAGLLLGSPANADPVPAQDVQAEELDIAIAIDHIQNATTLEIRRPAHVWAGLRSFVADGSFVGGYDADLPGFFWAAGQGGYGIQSSPAAGEAYAALIRGEAVPAHIARFGVEAAALSPKRLM
ncbi:NAD(P)/FAD-dependent oxidoreductase [Herbaspirillum rubrisubalbicans]|uniref:NAD(P)/FAD-dependent oxidoreductase n=1 Tax=Herbaspirillum rubrisubalbicans TaxID=80842 RepID=UPI0015594314|nr:FAD-dependent oxidoreductase [Herbaspirillum rubrisubalbicans]NQE49082.1 FAD-dependent oxidoreductase [Herbaspirillum rubrisubalbicans]